MKSEEKNGGGRMIDITKYETALKDLGGQYFIKDIQFVPDLTAWAKEKRQDLTEPYNPMKLVTSTGIGLIMIAQKEIKEEMLNDVIKNLDVRWTLRNTNTDIDGKLNSIKKRLVYCYLKERARTMKDIGGDEQVEDQWAIDEMENLGYFEE